MESPCPIDGETLSRFRDGELPPEAYLGIEAHLDGCPSCEAVLGRYRLADVVMSRAQLAASSGRQPGRAAASLSVAAALLASVAANLFLTPKAREVQPPPLRLPAAPSDTLSSFYERVASPPGRP
ncbi:MAG: zf-HC2 domain-containing protein [Vicinamibacteria bacterium]